jgi:two-component system sensor histidine kinase YesM
MRHSLRTKLMIVLLAATILPISISMLITYNRTTSAITEQAIKDNSKLLFQGKTNLMNYFELFNKLYNTVYFGSNNGDALFRLLQNGISPDNDDVTQRATISSTLQNMAMNSPDIFQVMLHFNEGDHSYLLSNGLLRYENHVQAPDADSIVWRTAGYVQPTHTSHAYGVDERKKFAYYFPQTVISFHRPILDIPSDREIGRLSIDLKMDYIRSISEMLYTVGKEELWIINEEGQAVFSSEKAMIGAALEDDWVKRIVEAQSVQGQFELQTDAFKGIVVYEKLENSYMNWTLAKRVPFRHLYSQAREITRINSLVLGFFLLITVITTIYISYQLTKPIKRLLASIHAMKSGNLDVDIPIQSNDEIGILARRFRQLMEQINHLILREYRLEIASKTNQLKALQAQINPHFMNNALQSIGTLALKHKDRKLYMLISSLGKLMRYNMNSEETIVPLVKEIDHVKAYMELQLQRFGDKLYVQFEIEPEVEQIEVPKMIVQPLVENVFKHGISKSDASIAITIRCCKAEDGALVIQVEDNGQGLSQEDRERLQAELDRPERANADPQQPHIGLANVVMRLRLFFNNESTILLTGSEGGGFTVSISIPMNEGGTAT